MPIESSKKPIRIDRSKAVDKEVWTPPKKRFNAEKIINTDHTRTAAGSRGSPS